MAQRTVEVVIGRLITDEEFRAEFLDRPHASLRELSDRGMRLNATEIAALVDTDPALWAEVADAIDPRLRKASLGARDSQGEARVESSDRS